MKRVIPLILLLTIIVVAGIYFISKVKTKPKEQVVSQEFPQGEVVFPLLGTRTAPIQGVSSEPLQNPPVIQPSIPSTQVSDSNTSTASETPKENPDVKSCGVAALGFSITVPVSWRCSLEERQGNALAFYSDSKEIGSIEVFLATSQSYDSLKREISADPENSSILERNMFAVKVLAYQSMRYAKSVAFVYRNNTYYFRNSLVDQSSLFVF